MHPLLRPLSIPSSSPFHCRRPLVCALCPSGLNPPPPSVSQSGRSKRLTVLVSVTKTPRLKSVDGLTSASLSSSPIIPHMPLMMQISCVHGPPDIRFQSSFRISSCCDRHRACKTSDDGPVPAELCGRRAMRFDVGATHSGRLTCSPIFSFAWRVGEYIISEWHPRSTHAHGSLYI